MSFTKAFLSLLLIALSVVDATPLIHRDSGKTALRFATRLNLDARSLSGSTLPELDRARVRSMKRAGHLGKRATIANILPPSVNIANRLVNYGAQVGVGNPPRNYTLLIDTGSSNLLVGLNQSNPYVPTNTSINTGNGFNITYLTGNITGEEWLDTVTLGPGLVIKNQSMGAVSSGSGLFNGVDGIIGVGPVGLTQKIVNNTYEVPTVMDNLYSQGTISQEVLGIYFVPASEPNNGGELTFGGYDSTVITSLVNYVPLTTTPGSSPYWGVNQTISYGGQTIMPNTAGIIDTGTTLTLIATDAYQKYQNLTGAVQDSATGLLSINATQYANLKTLSFNIGGTSYDFTPNAQIWPRSLNTAIGGNNNTIYLVINDAGAPSGSGSGFINGYTWLERFYAVYDTTNQRMGFATTAYTDSTAN